MVYRENDTGREGITVKIGGKVHGTYQGLGGTFATFVDCCLRKKALAGFHEKGLIVGAELKGNTLTLVLAGKRAQAKLAEITDIALPEYRGLSGKRGRCGLFYRGQIGKMKKGR